MPKQNRPLVRDGRLQARKKRTDRSYLRPASAEPAVEPAPSEEDQEPDASEVVRAAARAAVESEAAPERAEQPAPLAPQPETGKLPTAVRAIQQQGVRKRREFDIRALAIRDTNYAKHELRRIATLAAMVIVTLVVLTFVLR